MSCVADVTVTLDASTMIFRANEDPVRDWQSRQWQQLVNIGAVPRVYSIVLQKHWPFMGNCAILDQSGRERKL